MMRTTRVQRWSLIAPLSFTMLLAPLAGSAADYLTGPSEDDPLAIAESYVSANLGSLGLSAQDFADRVVTNRYTSAHNGVTHVYFGQRHAGIEVVNGLINVNVAADGRVINVGNRFLSDLAAKANATAPSITAGEAVAVAAGELGLTAPQLTVVESVGGPAQEVVFSGAGFSLEDVRVKLMYLKLGGGARLVWDLMIQPDDQHWWQMRVDAVAGKVQHKENRMLDDSYLVYEWPAESPNHVEPGPLPPADGRTTVGTPLAPGTSPGDPTGSPLGWHFDVETSGNNVFAQTDLDANNAFTPGTDVKAISPTLDFDFPLDLNDRPESYQEAMVTNLFYWNNVVHDILYLYGFDEPSGNFQQVNFQAGGLPADPVQADAQDGSGTNNANFGTPIDGLSPRMQMFIWLAPPTVRVNSPAGIAGDYPATAASFGAVLPEAGITGEFVLVDDGGGAGTASDGCEPIVNEVAGKIALIDRGTCEFGLKVLNAEQAGAAAAIVINNQGDGLVRMGPGASGGSVTISSVFIGQGDGNTIKSGLPGVNGTLSVAGFDRDSDLDNGVIIHEYGHGVSNRLTGGPGQVGCLGNLQQGGEGWSDTLALFLTARDGKNGTEARGIGTYLTFEDPVTGGGIRPFPYSTDTAVNPQTYGDLATGTLSVPHGVGSVWATTLWEMYWALVNGVPELGLPGSGFRQDLYDLSAPLAGNQKALQLVLDGMKLQPCSPTFLDARDAILAADLANYDGAHQCHIWWAFAKRGMGVDANDGFGTLQVTNGFGLPVECGGGGTCTSAPSFDGAEGVVSATDGNCSLTVNWSEATDNCDSGRVTYSVYRSTDPQFLPDPANLIASSVTATGYDDTTVESGVKYHYIVRAVDAFGNTDQNTVRKKEKPVGTLTPGGSFFDDAGDTAAQQFTPDLPPPTWAVRPNGGVGDSAVYATTASGNYADDLCLTLESDTVYLGPNPTLTFDTRWDIEELWDGGILEVSTQAGNFNDWQKLDTVPYPSIQNPLAATACPNPGLAPFEPVFNGTSGGLFVNFPASLAGYADQAVRIRFVFGSDASVNTLGWLVDGIGIDDVRDAGSCQQIEPNNPPDAVDDAASTPEDTPVTIPVLDNDTDPDPDDQLTVIDVTQPANGEAAISGGGPDNQVTYTPNPGFSGIDSFDYTISDGRGGEDTARVTVDVQRICDPDDDDDFDSDGKRDDADSDDDNDGDSDDSDPDDDNDGDSDDSDSDDDNDCIADEFDSESTREEQSQSSGSVPANGSKDSQLAVAPGTLLVIVAADGVGAEALRIEIFDPAGALVATSVSMPGRAMATAVPLASGNYTIRVNNPSSQAIDYRLTTVLSTAW